VHIRPYIQGGFPVTEWVSNWVELSIGEKEKLYWISAISTTYVRAWAWSKYLIGSDASYQVNICLFCLQTYFRLNSALMENMFFSAFLGFKFQYFKLTSYNWFTEDMLVLYFNVFCYGLEKHFFRRNFQHQHKNVVLLFLIEKVKSNKKIRAIKIL
jgi:hypothetical protein